MKSLRILAETTEKSITDIMQPHKDVLQDMIPPKKHLLRYQPANAQIGIMVRHTTTSYNYVSNVLRLFKCCIF